jgi:hypothetical protein
MTYVVPVTQGSHTVEVVARRLPTSYYKTEEDGAGATVQVMSRRLFVLRIKGMSGFAGTVPTLSIEPFDDGDTLSAASLVTNGFETLRTVVNALGADAVERGALANQHLASLIYGLQGHTHEGGSQNITSEYPGYATSAAGWTVLNDGATNLRVSGSWDLAANPGTVVVIANVMVQTLAWDVASEDMRAIGALALAYTNSVGTRTVVGNTEVYLNGNNPKQTSDAATPEQLPIYDDASLLWVVHSSDLSAANKLMNFIEVLGSVYDGATGVSPPAVTMNVRYGNLIAFVLRDVTT